MILKLDYYCKSVGDRGHPLHSKPHPVLLHFENRLSALVHASAFPGIVGNTISRVLT